MTTFIINNLFLYILFPHSVIYYTLNTELHIYMTLTRWYFFCFKGKGEKKKSERLNLAGPP